MVWMNPCESISLEIAAELIYLRNHEGQDCMCTQQWLRDQYHHDFDYYTQR